MDKDTGAPRMTAHAFGKGLGVYMTARLAEGPTVTLEAMETRFIPL